MTPRWAIRLDSTLAPAAAVLRAFPSIEICQQSDALWLRGFSDNPHIQNALWLLPGDRFHLDENSQLIPWNHLLPVAPAPTGPWLPLSHHLTPTTMPAALPAVISQKIPLRLIRSTAEQPLALLLTSIADWSQYANTAPAIRLARVRFAMNDSGQILAAGVPLPTLPGAFYTLEHGIALPAGLAFYPSFSAQAVASLLSLQPDETALFAPDASFQRIPPSAWVAASRSAVRMSAQGLGS